MRRAGLWLLVWMGVLPAAAGAQPLEGLDARARGFSTNRRLLVQAAVGEEASPPSQRDSAPPSPARERSTAETQLDVTPAVAGLESRPPLSPGRRFGLISLASGSLIAASALAGGGALAIHDAAFQATGRPDPLRTSGELLFAAAVGTLLSQLATPITLLAVDEGVPGGVSAARAEGWRRSRWSVLGSAVGIGIFATGGALERNRFGSGQALLVAGGITVLASYIVYCVTEVMGVVVGYERFRATPSG